MAKGRGIFRMRGNALLAVVALLVFSARALIPSGVMLGPDEASGRFFVVQLCTEKGYVDAKVDIATGRIISGESGGEKTPVQKTEHPPCAFAAAPGFIVLTTAVVLPVSPASAAPIEPAAATTATPGQGLAAPPPWSTGPPQIV